MTTRLIRSAPTWVAIAQAVLLVALGHGAAQAEDLGQQASTYALDADGRAQLRDVVRRKTARGDLQRFWRDYRDQVLRAAWHPTPLPIATSYRAQTIVRDAMYRLPTDYRDRTGRLIVARGTVIAPLERLPLSSAVLFIDGRDESQLRLAAQRARQEPVKVVLVAGSPLALRERLPGVALYLDQRAMLTTGLQRLYGLEIASVPALMRQQGHALRVDFGMPAGAGS